MCIVRKIYSILSLVLILFVITGSVGIHYYKTYCSMRGQTYTFLTSGNDLCDILPPIKEKTCCSEKAKMAHCLSDEKSNGCCGENEITVLIELDYVEHSPVYAFTSFLLSTTFTNAIPFKDVRQVALEQTYYRPPPRYYGKTLITHVANWRL